MNAQLRGKQKLHPFLKSNIGLPSPRMALPADGTLVGQTRYVYKRTRVRNKLKTLPTGRRHITWLRRLSGLRRSFRLRSENQGRRSIRGHTRARDVTMCRTIRIDEVLPQRWEGGREDQLMRGLCCQCGSDSCLAWRRL